MPTSPNENGISARFTNYRFRWNVFVWKSAVQQRVHHARTGLFQNMNRFSIGRQDHAMTRRFPKWRVKGQ
jgi:hypothetical protein